MGQANSLGNCYQLSSPPEGSCCSTAIVAPGKLRPLLCGMEMHFAKMADTAGRISASDLKRVWQECAQKKLGSLCEEDYQIIDNGVESYFQARYLTPQSRVNHADFMSFMLDGTEGSNDGSVAANLRQKAADNSQGLNEFALEFATGKIDFVSRHCEPNRVRVSLSEFTQCLKEFLPQGRDHLNDPCAASVIPNELASSLFQALGVSQHGRLDLYNALAYVLDRRKTSVELVLYDISHGASQMFSQALLGRQFEAIYHTSVLVFGTEFWYGGQVFENEPPIDPTTFGPPLSDSVEGLKPSVYNGSLKTIHLGSTLSTLFELREFLQKQMKSKYRQDNYDVLSHNCNCFSDDVVRFLTGKGIPENISRLPELVMSTSGAQLLRPFLNRWLRSFEASPDEPSPDAGAVYSNTNFVREVTKADEEEFNAWEEAVAVVAKDTSIDVDLGYFDPAESNTLTRKSIRRDAVKREESGRLIRPKSREEVAFRLASREMQEPQERKEIRRSAIRRLVDGRIVQAKLV